MHTFRFFFLCLILCATLASCGKKESAANSSMSIDTTKKAEPVAITDTSHHLFFRPKAGSVQRYHIVDRLSMSSSDTPPGTAATKHSASSTTEIFLRQTVKDIRRDSSVGLTVRIDSILLTSDRDTTKTQYSSNNLKDRMSQDYDEFNILVGKDFSLVTNKYGDLDSITDIHSITTAMLATLPDSQRNSPQVFRAATQQAEEVVNAYLMRVLVHSPTRALKQDTTWRSASDVNMDIAPNLAFPVHIEASETVRGLEKRDDLVLAVLEDSQTTTPRKLVFDEGPTKATISNFRAISQSIVRIEDATGLLYHRAIKETRNFTLVIESKEHAGDKRTVTQNGSEELLTERIE
jgi:Family of unknown function (DUF6263)